MRYRRAVGGDKTRVRVTAQAGQVRGIQRLQLVVDSAVQRGSIFCRAILIARFQTGSTATVAGLTPHTDQVVDLASIRACTNTRTNTVTPGCDRAID